MKLVFHLHIDEICYIIKFKCKVEDEVKKNGGVTLPQQAGDMNDSLLSALTGSHKTVSLPGRG